ncbi:hypothetical protein [Halobacillus naozhouensis]|uniref:DUF485 domain-containing protein n=1 Tax=Halobacillus naozhouensis TaxID=554880 RepID=A0ABY8IW79_9BACI|nr:hypothetical protein [Halobacillus naozhouensis]WFT74477.1 hypothetical protein P9989_19320 [Halobacillus naozhouensis]
MKNRWWRWIRNSLIGIAVFGFAELLVIAYFDGTPINIQGVSGGIFGIIVAILFTSLFIFFVSAFIYGFTRVNALLERDIPREFEDR